MYNSILLSTQTTGEAHQFVSSIIMICVNLVGVTHCTEYYLIVKFNVCSSYNRYLRCYL